jgi:uncharacterized protein (DUF1499 family)
MIAAWLGFFDALLAITLIAVGPLGAHLGLVAPFLGFQLFLFGMLLGIVGLLLGLVGLFMTRRSPASGERRRAMLGTIIGGALTVLTVVIVSRSIGYAPINDITTDTDNPPEFVKAGDLPSNRGRDLKYDKAKYADRQKLAYSELAPLPMRGQPSEIYEKVKTAAEQMPGWTVTYDDPSTDTIEGVAISGLFRFQDDFVIQVRAAGGQNLVEMRSKSRDGIGDMGTNAARIRAYFKWLSGDTDNE